MDVFQSLFIIAFVFNFGNVILYRKRAYAGERFGHKEEGNRLWIPLRFGGLLMFAYIVTLMVSPRSVAWSLIELPTPLRWVGAAIALLVVPPLMLWTQRSLGKNVSPTVITRENHELVTHGPYRYVRHPLYLVGMLFYLSLGLLSGSWLLMAMTAVAFVLISIRTPKEEAMLHARFGKEYEDYRERTGRFFPKIFFAK